MIRVQKRHSAAPKAFRSVAMEETRRTLELYKKARGKTVKAIFAAYRHPELKKELDRIFNGKCAYCEWRYGGGSFLQVEHYRPKSHYYWLAAEWTNLLPSCEICNNSKRERFPLKDPKKLARKPGQEVGERPLLLNPANPKMDPQKHLQFSAADGAIRPQQIRGRVSERGEASIRVYKLARKDLSQERKGWARRVQVQIDRCYRAALRRDAKEEKLETQELKLLLQPDQPFKALTIQILRERGFRSPAQTKRPASRRRRA